MIKIFLSWWFMCSFLHLGITLIFVGIDCPNVFLIILGGPIGLIIRIIRGKSRKESK